MALSGSTIFEVRSTAISGNVNGGGFNPANANMLTDLAATSATGNSPVVSSASYNFAAGDVGAWVYVQSGTNWTPGWYQIASVASNQATLSASVGAAIQVSNNRFGANTVAGCATTASPTGGTWAIDYSQQDAAQAAFTNLGSASGSKTLTDNSSGGLFTAPMTGNLIHITAGTNATAGWYEIASVTDSNNVVLDRTPHGANTMSATTGKVGGAVSLGATGTNGDNNFFSSVIGQIDSSGRYFLKNGSYTISEAVTTGTSDWIEGYNSLRGDRPTDSTRPVLSVGTNIFSLGSPSYVQNISFIGSGSNVLAGGGTISSNAVECKVVNNSTTAGRNAFTSFGFIKSCEAVSYRGIGISGFTTHAVVSCYIHDCNVGIQSGASLGIYLGNIIAGCVTEAINLSSSSALGSKVIGNTLYGAENKLGTGLNAISSAVSTMVINNIFYGFSTAVSSAATTNQQLADYNDYYNNTSDVNGAGNWQKGANDIAVDPQFSSIGQVSGTGATTTTGNHIVDASATFVSSGVVAGRDYVYVLSGTGVTAGVYGILSVDSETQITTDIAITANATADKAYQITVKSNFAPGSALKAKGFPSIFPAGLTRSFVDIGAAQVAAPNYQVISSSGNAVIGV